MTTWEREGIWPVAFLADKAVPREAEATSAIITSHPPPCRQFRPWSTRHWASLRCLCLATTEACSARGVIYCASVQERFLQKEGPYKRPGGTTPVSVRPSIAQPPPVPRCGRMSLPRARLSSPREGSCRRRAEQAGERRKGNRTPQNVCPVMHSAL